MYINSKTPGHTWLIYASRTPQGLHCVATEGKEENGMFMFEPFSNRQERTMLASKRLTAKVESDAIEAMKQNLIAKGFA